MNRKRVWKEEGYEKEGRGGKGLDRLFCKQAWVRVVENDSTLKSCSARHVDSVGDVVIAWSLWLTKMVVLFLVITVTKC